MQFGTPLQDALRRDLTINALFYNINDACVEDLTGKGLSDLRDGIIRTPLEPRTTFIDDPLRVMRAIRFGTRFNYRFDDELVRAAQLPDVKDALMSKVSRERIGQELYGIFNQAPVPLSALRVAADWNVFDVIFRSTLWNPARVAFALAVGQRSTAAHDVVAPGAPHTPSLVVASLLAPLAGHKALVLKKPPPLVTYIVSDSLKWSNRDATNVQMTLDAALLFRSTLRGVESVAIDEATLEHLFNTVEDAIEPTTLDNLHVLRAARVALGKVLREAGELWRDALCLSFALDELIGTDHPLLLDDGHGAVVADMALIDRVGASLPAVPSDPARFARIERIVSLIRDELRLEGVWGLKPLLDGRQLQVLLNLQAGPWLNVYRERLLERQFAYPSMIEDDARRFVLLMHQREQQQQ
jgi:tRNA nucleotidyltransferase (CCA-adding enzyme)